MIDMYDMLRALQCNMLQRNMQNNMQNDLHDMIAPTAHSTLFYSNCSDVQHVNIVTCTRCICTICNMQYNMQK